MRSHLNAADGVVSRLRSVSTTQPNAPLTERNSNHELRPRRPSGSVFSETIFLVRISLYRHFTLSLSLPRCVDAPLLFQYSATSRDPAMLRILLNVLWIIFGGG